MSTDQGTGTTAAFGTSGFQTGVTFIDISGTASRGSVETTHLGTTTAKTFEPEDLYDGGEVTMTIDWDATEVSATGGFMLVTAAETVTITFPNGSWAASMFCTSINWGPVAVNQRMTANITLKVTGAITNA